MVMLMRQRIAMDVNLNWKWEALGVRGLLFPEPEKHKQDGHGKGLPIEERGRCFTDTFWI